MALSFKDFFHRVFNLYSEFKHIIISKPTLHSELFITDFDYQLKFSFAQLNELYKNSGENLKISKNDNELLQKLFHAKIERELKTKFIFDVPNVTDVKVLQTVNTVGITLHIHGQIRVPDPDQIYDVFVKLKEKDDSFDDDELIYLNWYAKNVEDELAQAL